MFVFDNLNFPDYELRISRRARHVRIKVTPLGEIVVVIPAGMDPATVPRLLEKKRAWLQSVLQQIAERQGSAPASHSLQPDRIELMAIDETWQVEYARQRRQKPMISAPHRRLVLNTDLSSRTNAGHLRDWLQQRARQVLPEWLQQTSEEVGLPFTRVQIRGQKTRWGSCSSRHTISLNRNLLLLPAATVRYLLIHELCHTRHMNHSASFWRLVSKLMPDYQRHENHLRAATRTLPLWTYV
jgi:predicted metal-dependent hydrolase